MRWKMEPESEDATEIESDRSRFNPTSLILLHQPDPLHSSFRTLSARSTAPVLVRPSLILADGMSLRRGVNERCALVGLPVRLDNSPPPLLPLLLLLLPPPPPPPPPPPVIFT